MVVFRGLRHNSSRRFAASIARHALSGGASRIARGVLRGILVLGRRAAASPVPHRWSSRRSHRSRPNNRRRPLAGLRVHLRPTHHRLRRRRHRCWARRAECRRAERQVWPLCAGYHPSKGESSRNYQHYRDNLSYTIFSSSGMTQSLCPAPADFRSQPAR